MTEIDNTMAEPPGGGNQGRAIPPIRVKDDDVSRTRALPLDGVAADFLRGDGWHTVSAEGGRQLETSGLTTHRGALHPDEYVDYFGLREQVEADLGFTYADVSAAYSQGRPTAEQRQLREKIDARLLALSRAGGNMLDLARAFGWPVEAADSKGGARSKTMERALARAREVEVVQIVRNPALVHDRACFVCEAKAKRRKRKSPDTPAHLRGTVDLCDDCYARGFEHRKGNPAYWGFRDDRTPLPWPKRKPKPEQLFPADWPSDKSYRDFVEGERAVA